MMKHPDVLVLGGGIIGLACARELARRGLVVEILERDRVGGGASWAAAGMLSPLAESVDSRRFLDACRYSRDLWQTWARELEAESGVDVDYDRAGALVIDHPEGGRIGQLARLAEEIGEPTVRVDADELRSLVPDISPAASGALLLLGDHRIDNRRVCKALRLSLEKAGVRISEGREATRVLLSGDAVRLEGDGWARCAGGC